ncbi:MAG: c-type cytochrome [Thermoanaerobaculia bacterium]
MISLGPSACSKDRDLPEPYRRLPVPSGLLDSAAARENGRKLFLASCALCHGERADGRGVRREGLSSPPRDFTNPSWRAATTPRRVFFAIREGVHGTPMPGWKSFSDAQTWDLVAFLLSEAH